MPTASRLFDSGIDVKNGVAMQAFIARKLINCGSMNDGTASDRLAGEALDDEAFDHCLMERLHQGDHDAATAIYMRYADRLLGVARRKTPNDLRTRFDPEDVVQSVFRTFFRRAAGGAYAVPEGEELWKLFLVIALNKIRRLGNFHRSAKRDVSKTAALIAPAEEGEGADDSVRLLQLTIDELLLRCPEHAREMVRLRVEGCDVAEIAARTSRSKRSVERVLQHFRELLTSELEGVDASIQGDRP